MSIKYRGVSDFGYNRGALNCVKALETYLYVDGFNLNYGAVKGASYKWLDLSALIEYPLN